MHTKLFTDPDDVFQIIVILQRKGDGYLIQLILGEDHLQIGQSSQHLDPLVEGACRNVVIQDSHGHIPPLGIVIDAVNILLRRPGISYQQNMLQVVALPAKRSKPVAQRNPKAGGKQNIEAVKEGHHRTGHIELTDQKIQQDDQAQNTDGIGLHNTEDLEPLADGPLRCVHIAKVINDQIDGENHFQET